MNNNNDNDNHNNDNNDNHQEGGRPKPAARSKNRERRERLAKVFRSIPASLLSEPASKSSPFSAFLSSSSPSLPLEVITIPTSYLSSSSPPCLPDRLLRLGLRLQLGRTAVEETRSSEKSSKAPSCKGGCHPCGATLHAQSHRKVHQIFSIYGNLVLMLKSLDQRNKRRVQAFWLTNVSTIKVL